MLNYVLYRIGEFIALSIPLKLGYRLAVIISDLHYFFAFADRKSVKQNLRAIFPEKSEYEIKRIRKRMFRNFAKYLVDFFRFSKLDQEFIQNNIKVENIRYLDEALSRGKGVIVLTAHLGNWELGGVVIALLKYPFWVVALVHKHKKVNDFFNNQRKSKNINVIPFGKAARQCLNLLKRNKIVALVGDRDFSEKGVLVDFFGKKTQLPPGPAAFALKTNAVIVPGFMFRNPDDTFTLRIEKPIEADSQQDDQWRHEENLSKIIDRYKIVLEDYIKEFPDQWYMFKKFWVD